jgi:thiol-disulfide isomerase/thioredoxin
MIVKPALTLYTRVGCHLCDEMMQQLEWFQQQYDFSLTVVDIDADSYLKQCYGKRVPVLAAGDREICHYYLDEDLLLGKLDAERRSRHSHAWDREKREKLITDN